MAALSSAHAPNFVLIAESWAKESLSKAFFEIPGYELTSRRDRTDTTNGIGGGLLIYTKADMVGNVAEVNISMSEKFTQCCIVNVHLHDKSKLSIALIYRPHHIYKDTVPQPEATKENNINLETVKFHDPVLLLEILIIRV